MIKTIILPGYSEHNKVWAEEVVEKFKEKGIEALPHSWLH